MLIVILMRMVAQSGLRLSKICMLVYNVKIDIDVGLVIEPGLRPNDTCMLKYNVEINK